MVDGTVGMLVLRDHDRRWWQTRRSDELCVGRRVVDEHCRRRLWWVGVARRLMPCTREGYGCSEGLAGDMVSALEERRAGEWSVVASVGGTGFQRGWSLVGGAIRWGFEAYVAVVVSVPSVWVWAIQCHLAGTENI